MLVACQNLLVPSTSPPDSPDPRAVNAPRIGPLPFVALASLAMTMGIVDAFAFDKFGVFTTNQAGNLVVFVSGPWNVGGKAVLAGGALLGAGVGAVLGAGLYRLAGGQPPRNLLWPLMAGALLLLPAPIVNTLYGRPSWLVPVMAAATGCMAGGWMLAAAPKMWLTANTGAYLAAVTATVYPDGEDADGRRRRFQRTPSRTAAMSTLGFIGGILIYSSGITDRPHPVLVALVPTALAVLVTILDERNRRREAAQSASETSR